jgi:hypothetical protein
VTQQPGPLAGPQSTLYFTLYSRSYCHLCEDMLAALRAFMARSGLAWTVDVIDVDSDPQLTDMFDELVPVLYASDAANVAGSAAPGGQEICHYFLDEAALQRYLAAHGMPAVDQAAQR